MCSDRNYGYYFQKVIGTVCSLAALESIFGIQATPSDRVGTVGLA
jgi:hypothetical protein